jgi:hypothetical protein
MTSAPGIHTDLEVAARLGKSKWFVQEQCRLKRWPHLRVGKSFRFTDAHLERIEQLLEVQPTAAAKAAKSWDRRTRGG